MLRFVIHFLTWFFFQINGIFQLPMWLYFRLQTPKKCPPVHDDIYFQPATFIAEQIRNQNLSSVFVVSMYIKRAKEVNEVLNAIVEGRFDLALKEAKHADDIVKNSGLSVEELEQKYPLLGVPLTIKESIAVAGMSFSACSKIRPQKAVIDAEVVEMLKSAGAIIYLVSTTPELCMNWETMNYVTGRTLNPYDTRRTCGGSSGGESALLATCGSLIGLGSDLVGSARGPPSFCGVYGHRTSSDLTSTAMHIPQVKSTALTLCPITRYAIDLPLMLKCMVPPEKVKEIKLLEAFEPKRIRIYYMFGSGSNFPTSAVSSQIVLAMQKVVKHLDNDGFYTKKVEVKSFANQFDIAFVNLLSIPGIYEEMSYRNISVFVELLRSLFGCARIALSILLYAILGALFRFFASKQQIERHRKLLSEMKVELEEMLGDDGVLLYPTYPSVASVHGRIYAKMMDTCYMGIFNVLDMPTTVIPIGQDKNGLPIGIQVVAKHNNDRIPMVLARHLETSFGGWKSPNYA